MTPLCTTHLLYLHGFRSSPQSTKARLVGERMVQAHPFVHWWCPQLPPSPAETMAMLLAGTADWPFESMAVVGSSLGGFYAMHVAERTGCRAVLLNPAVHPARDLASHIGTQTQWHDPSEAFRFEPRFVDELHTLESDVPLPTARCMAIIAKGDEVLDWREMVARCAGARIDLLEAGDHALSDFETHHLDAVIDFIDPA